MTENEVKEELLPLLSEMFQFCVWHCNGMCEADHLSKIGNKLMSLNKKYGVKTWLDEIRNDPQVN